MVQRRNRKEQDAPTELWKQVVRVDLQIGSPYGTSMNFGEKHEARDGTRKQDLKPISKILSRRPSACR